MFYPQRRALHYAIYHDLTFRGATNVRLFIGNPSSGGQPIASKNLRTYSSPVRGVIAISRDQWNALVAGNIYVVVSTNSDPLALVGQITCDQPPCSSPPTIDNPITPQSPQCSTGAPNANILPIYTVIILFSLGFKVQNK
jgi:hypothetical protein